MHSCTYAIKEQKYYTSGVGIIHLDRVNPIYMEFLVTSNSTPLRAPNALSTNRIIVILIVN